MHVNIFVLNLFRPETPRHKCAILIMIMYKTQEDGSILEILLMN